MNRNAAVKAKYLVVLTVLEGRGFLNRPNSKLVIEAKFDGELLTTDAVAHTTNPFMNTELAWEVDISCLNTAKLQRTPIKIQSFIEDSNGMKTLIGYCLVDIRAAHHNDKAPKWHSLLGAKSTNKPQLKLGLALEMDKTQVSSKSTIISNGNVITTAPTSSKTDVIIQEVKKPAETIPALVSPERLRPILDEEGIYYQIGPSDKCAHIFNFSVTIGFVSNLQQLIPSSSAPGSSSKGFFFYYSLLGNDIFTDPFYDHRANGFSPERANVKLRSDLPALRSYFALQPGIQVHLCQGENSLGWAEVPVIKLFENIGTNNGEDPIVTEEMYELHTSRQSQLQKLPPNMKPVVGIQLCLQRKDEVSKPESILTPLNERIATQVHEVLTLSDDDEFRPCTPPPSERNLISNPRVSHTPPEKLSKGNQSARHQSVASQPDNQPHEYLLTFELQSVTDCSISSSINCIIRFSYPPLGKMTPILTHPHVELKPESTVFLPNGITKFNFQIAPHVLQQHMATEPFTLELIHYDKATDENNILGIGSAFLEDLFKKQNTSLKQAQSGKSYLHRHWDDTIEIFSVIQRTLLLAKVDVDVTLEDYGRVVTAMVDEAPKQIPILDPDIISDVALEVERWKEMQETMFIAKLKEKEAQHLQMLTSEWRTRERERENLMQMKLSEYEELEDKLHKTIADVEKREKQLGSSESEMKQTKIDVKLQRDRELKQFDDGSRRMRDECNHQVELERNRTLDLQEQGQKLRAKVADLEKKLDNVTAEFRSYREKQQQPELQIQSELKMLQLQKSQLENKVDALTKSKVHYKQQWGRCLRELGRLKKAMQSQAEMQLHQRQMELNELKQQLAASTNQQEVENERRKLMNLKLELDKVKIDEAQRNSRAESRIPDTSSVKSRTPLTNLTDNDLLRLINERDILLNTGVYSNNDDLIITLNDQIKQLEIHLGK